MVHSQIAKRNRVYSLESNKLLGISFARKYVNYLEPALKKINEKALSISSTKPNGDDDDDDVKDCIEKLVRFEVDMAMAVSAKDQCAWSRSLEAQLQLRNSAGRILFQQHLASNKSNAASIIVDQEKVGESLLGSTSFIFPPHGSNSAMVPPMHIPKKYNHSFSSISKTSTGGRRKVQVQEAKNGEERIVKKRMRQLRMVLPGGKEMGDDVELLTEIATYITCLQLQLSILQCLVEN